jgi:hypothetical protein
MSCLLSFVVGLPMEVLSPPSCFTEARLDTSCCRCGLRLIGVEEIRPMLTCHHEVYQRLPGILISLPGYVPCKAPPLFAFNGLPLLPCSSCSVVLISETTVTQLFGGLGRHCLNSVAHQLVNIWSSPGMSACEYEDMRPYCRVAPMGSHSGHLCESFHHLRPP